MSHTLRWRNVLHVVTVGSALTWVPRADAQPEAMRERPDVLLPVECKTAFVNAQLWIYVLQKNEKTGKLEIKVMSDGRGEKLRFVPADDLAKLENTRLLHTVRPQRMALIAASFPYKAQVQEFRRKLRLQSDNAVLDETLADKVKAFRFLGVDVERRHVDASGKPLRPEEGADGYVPLDIASQYKALLVLNGGQVHDEDPELKDIEFDGLVMPRLYSARGEEAYPKIERELPTLRKSLEALKGRNTIPDHCLIRVIDSTVRPGERYQYRIRVRMANPNYTRSDVARPRDAEETDLKPADASKWFEVPEIVTVPTELRLYAVDQKAVETDYKGAYKDVRVGPDQTALQIHKYLDYINPTPRQSFAAAEWSVAERVVVSRGEIIDRPVRVEVPILVEEEQRWKLASTQTAHGNEAGVDVLFDGARGRPAILVDFDRGSKTYKRTGGNAEVKDQPAEEVLILGPDGRLRAHNSGVDAADMGRRETLQMWRERVNHVRKQGLAP